MDIEIIIGCEMHLHLTAAACTTRELELEDYANRIPRFAPGQSKKPAEEAV